MMPSHAVPIPAHREPRLALVLFLLTPLLLAFGVQRYAGDDVRTRTDASLVRPDAR